MTDLALEATDISVRFGGLKVLDGVDLAVVAGHTHAILGPNGAGKTTLFNALSGLVAIDRGNVRMYGEDITGHSAFGRARAGMVRTFQITNLMPSLTVEENILLAALPVNGEASSWWRPHDRARKSREAVSRVIDDFDLSPVATERLSELSYGQQRQIEFAVTLAAEPKLVLLDEPAAGLSVEERHHIVEILKNMPANITKVIVEHDVDLVFSVADQITLLDDGKVVITGTPEEIRGDARVQIAYLGEPG